MYNVPLGLQYIYGRSNEGGENGDGEEGSEISGGGKSGDCLASCMQIDLVLWGELEEDLRAMVGHFVGMCRKRGL